ncbi:hypothetical protein [Sphingomonas lacusdianchii]|uniref:hypothetical protein n=1 Tax=Sphingomonas lacusdianchii TaxID=2917992 RepID=UPI001F561E27|nr:hypothetical protein [Sphingomonas sp. JXJ CY 53]
MKGFKRIFGEFFAALRDRLLGTRAIDSQGLQRIFVIPAQAGIHSRYRLRRIGGLGPYGLPPARE